MLPTFGKLPSGERLKRIQQSPNYRDGKFHNLNPTVVGPEGKLSKVFEEWWNKPKTTKPTQALPFVKTDLLKLEASQPHIIWFGHSSYLLAYQGYHLLIDPVFSGFASPIWGLVKPFGGADEYEVEHMPDIDLLVLTHDHYDHLDYETIKPLIPKVRQVVCALGLGSHLEHWGMKPDIITELDWYEAAEPHPQVKLVAQPARHFTGRGIKRFQTLWCSFVLDFFGHHIFVGGDSGFDAAFATIGAAHGPFELALLECGQYGKYWPDIHMTPEQTVQAGLDLKAKCVMPVHWGKFQLSTHAWDDSIQRFVTAADRQGLDWTMPLNGQPMPLGQCLRTPWWTL